MKERAAIFEIFPDRKGKFRWHLKRGGRVVADSGEAYARQRGAQRAITNLSTAIADGKYRVDVLEKAPAKVGGKRKQKRTK